MTYAQAVHVLKAKIASLVESNQYTLALVRLEGIIHDVQLLEVYSILQACLEAVDKRVEEVIHSKQPPNSLLKAISTIIFASKHAYHELDELPRIARALLSKHKTALRKLYQCKDFAKRVTCADAAVGLDVDRTVVANLSMIVGPWDKLVRLKQISDEFGVDVNDQALKIELQLPASTPQTRSRESSITTMQYSNNSSSNLSFQHSIGQRLSFSSNPATPVPTARPAQQESLPSYQPRVRTNTPAGHNLTSTSPFYDRGAPAGAHVTFTRGQHIPPKAALLATPNPIESVMPSSRMTYSWEMDATSHMGNNFGERMSSMMSYVSKQKY